MTPQPTAYTMTEAQALEVWRVLEAFTQSMRRLGQCEITLGSEIADRETLKYVGPNLFQELETARTIMLGVLLNQNPVIREHLENLSDDEEYMRYWGRDFVAATGKDT